MNVDPNTGRVFIYFTESDYINTDPNNPQNGVAPGEYCVNVKATNSADTTNSPKQSVYS